MLSPRYLPLAIVTCLFVLSHASRGNGATQPSTHPIWIFEDGLDRLVDVDVPPGTVIEYENDENCGNPEHRTKHGGAFYRHLHITYSLPQSGVDNHYTIRVVTNTKIDAYWNQAVPGRYGFPHFTQLSPPDHKRNCGAHAFLVGPWVQSPGANLILQLDYRPTGAEVEEGNVLPCQGIYHILRLDRLCPPAPYYPQTGKETTQKNRASGIYKATYSCSGIFLENAYEERP